MAVTELSWFNLILSSSLLALLYLYLRFKFSSSKYWEKRNVPYIEPAFLVGNLWNKGISMDVWAAMEKFHLENPQHKILGFWMFTKPVLLILDLEIVKRVLIKDFNVFRDRGIEMDTELEPLSSHLFLLNGKRWRNLRVRLTPTFTSGKMKMMFPTMVNCGVELQKHLKKSAEAGEPVEVKDVMARFTTDVISSVAFGIEANSLQNPNSEFRMFGRKIFAATLKTLITITILFTFPSVLKKLKLRIIPKDVSDFFMNAVRETVEFREKNNVTRNDFLQLLIQLMRAGKIEDVDKTPVDGLTDDEIVQKFSLEEAASQCFIFFVAGFDTSSSLLTIALYELALNPDIQARLQDELDWTLGTQSSEISYETLYEMKYLDMVVQETLRKYPPAGNIQRISASDYHIPELGATIDKGTTVMISVTAIHHDPRHYPNPDKFDPERFSPEITRNPFAYLPFGEGPRNCIGNRFALMQIKVCLVMVLSKFSVDVCETTPIPIAFEKLSFMDKGGVPLVFKIRA